MRAAAAAAARRVRRAGLPLTLRSMLRWDRVRAGPAAVGPASLSPSPSFMDTDCANWNCLWRFLATGGATTTWSSSACAGCGISQEGVFGCLGDGHRGPG